jgi:hypothetical protein
MVACRIIYLPVPQKQKSDNTAAGIQTNTHKRRYIFMQIFSVDTISEMNIEYNAG